MIIRGVLPAQRRASCVALVLSGVAFALTLGFAPSTAFAACTPTPANSGDTVTCSGTDTDGVGSGVENQVTVTVNPGATIAPAVASFGINLNNLNSIINNGTLTGDGGIGVTDQNTIVNNATINGGSVGIAAGNGNIITNNGALSGGSTALGAQDFNTITNNGTISSNSGAGLSLGSNNAITNNGSVSGSIVGLAMFDYNTVVNNGIIGTIGGSQFGLIAQDHNNITNNGTINGSQFGLFAQDRNSIINNGLIGAGDGGAALVLAGRATVINNGTIEAGALGASIATFPPGGAVHITNNGRLDGTISIPNPDPNTLINNGTITISNPNTPLGDQAGLSSTGTTLWHFIEGTFTQTAGGTLELRVNNVGFSDGLGAADPHLGGTLRAVVQPGLYNAVTTYSSVVYNCGCTSGDLNGTQFDKVTSSSPFFMATANYVENSALGSGINAVDLVLTRLPFGAVPGETINQRAVGNALEQGYSTTLTGNAATFYSNLLTATSSVGVLDQLSGEGTIATQSTSFLASTLFVNAIMGAASGSFGAPGASTGPLGYAAARREHPAFKAFTKAPDIDDPARWRFSIGGFGGSLTTRGDAAIGSANQVQSGGAGVASLSYLADSTLLVGAAISGGRFSFSSAPRATSGDIDASQAGLFVRKDWNTFRITAALNGATFDNTTSRFISGIGPTELARASFTSNLVGGRVEIARPCAFAGLNVTPFAAIQPATLWQRARTETSVVFGTNTPGMLGLSYAPVSVTSLPTFLGVQLDTSFDLGGGRILTPVARLAWVHEFRPDRSQDATFLSIPGPNFTVFGPRAASDAAQLDAGLQLALNSSAVLQANFSSELSGASSRYSGSGALRVAW